MGESSLPRPLKEQNILFSKSEGDPPGPPSFFSISKILSQVSFFSNPVGDPLVPAFMGGNAPPRPLAPKAQKNLNPQSQITPNAPSLKNPKRPKPETVSKRTKRPYIRKASTRPNAPNPKPHEPQTALTLKKPICPKPENSPNAPKTRMPQFMKWPKTRNAAEKNWTTQIPKNPDFLIWHVWSACKIRLEVKQGKSYWSAFTFLFAKFTGLGFLRLVF